jgi:hypothetical protein
MMFKVTPAANEVFNAREGEHDDLLLALALAAWNGERTPPFDPPVVTAVPAIRGGPIPNVHSAGGTGEIS